MKTHTATPYTIFTDATYKENGERKGWQFLIGNETAKGYVASIDCGNKDINFEQEKANAEFIVRACNSHAMLVNALSHAKMCIKSLGGQLERYHIPSWQYQQTLEGIESALKQCE